MRVKLKTEDMYEFDADGDAYFDGIMNNRRKYLSYLKTPFGEYIEIYDFDIHRTSSYDIFTEDSSSYSLKDLDFTDQETCDNLLANIDKFEFQAQKDYILKHTSKLGKKLY